MACPSAESTTDRTTRRPTYAAPPCPHGTGGATQPLPPATPDPEPQAREDLSSARSRRRHAGLFRMYVLNSGCFEVAARLFKLNIIDN